MMTRATGASVRTEDCALPGCEQRMTRKFGCIDTRTSPCLSAAASPSPLCCRFTVFRKLNFNPRACLHMIN